MIPLSTFPISFVAFSICLFIIILIFVPYFNRNFSSASSSRRNCFCLADPEHQFEITTFFGVFPRDGGDEKLSGISVFTYFPSEPDYSISNHEPHLVCKQFCASRLLHLLRNFLLCHSNLLQDQIGATGGKDNSERNVHSYKHLFSFNHFNLHPAALRFSILPQQFFYIRKSAPATIFHSRNGFSFSKAIFPALRRIC